MRPGDSKEDSILAPRQYNQHEGKINPLKSSRKSKGNPFHHVPCTPKLYKSLTEFIAFNNITGSQTIFQRSNGEPIFHRGLALRFKNDQKNWGGTCIRFHYTRHTAITLLLNDGTDIKTLQEIAGHSNISTTEKYLHVLGHSIKAVSHSRSVLPDPSPKKLRLIDT